MTLVVITVGWPLTAAQQQAVEAARGLAREHGIVFDAILVGSLDEGLETVSTRDRVLLGTDRRETRRVQQDPARAAAQRSRRAMTWMSMFEAFRNSSFTNDPRSSSCMRDRTDSPTTNCVTNCA